MSFLPDVHARQLRYTAVTAYGTAPRRMAPRCSAPRCSAEPVHNGTLRTPEPEVPAGRANSKRFQAETHPTRPGSHRMRLAVLSRPRCLVSPLALGYRPRNLSETT